MLSCYSATFENILKAFKQSKTFRIRILLCYWLQCPRMENYLWKSLIKRVEINVKYYKKKDILATFILPHAGRFFALQNWIFFSRFCIFMQRLVDTRFVLYELSIVYHARILATFFTGFKSLWLSSGGF